MVKAAIISWENGETRLAILKSQLRHNFAGFVQIYAGAVLEVETLDGVIEVYIKSFIERGDTVICEFNET